MLGTQVYKKGALTLEFYFKNVNCKKLFVFLEMKLISFANVLILFLKTFNKEIHIIHLKKRPKKEV